MNRRAYELANRIGMNMETNAVYGAQGRYGMGMQNEEAEKYKKAVLEKIQGSSVMENAEATDTAETRGEQRHKQKQSRRIIAAACAVALVGSLTLFGEEVHAAIEQISWSISSALGLSEDVAKYCDVVDTSTTDAGYVITLQEAIAAEDKLVLAYTLQREDGEPMEEVRIPQAGLFINGTEMRKGFVGGGQFVDDEHTMVGIEATYYVIGIDMAQENSYQLLFKKIDSQTKGEWDFRFTADGTDLAADSIRIPLQKEFVINEKADIILEELVLNKLEQKIAFHIDGPSGYVVSNYDMQVAAEDEDGHIVEFDVRWVDHVRGNGYMLNNTYLDDGWIAEDTDLLTLTFSVREIVQENGQTKRGDLLLEESFVVDCK